MKAEQRELFRDTILRSFRQMRGGMNLATLAVIVRSCGFKDFENADLEEDIQYFVDKGFLADVPKSHSVAIKLWRITAAGIDDLEGRGI
jgi:hypothetical protein